jgi:hypothetical protein
MFNKNLVSHEIEDFIINSIPYLEIFYKLIGNNVENDNAIRKFIAARQEIYTIYQSIDLELHNLVEITPFKGREEQVLIDENTAINNTVMEMRLRKYYLVIVEQMRYLTIAVDTLAEHTGIDRHVPSYIEMCNDRNKLFDILKTNLISGTKDIDDCMCEIDTVQTNFTNTFSSDTFKLVLELLNKFKD